MCPEGDVLLLPGTSGYLHLLTLKVSLTLTLSRQASDARGVCARVCVCVCVRACACVDQGGHLQHEDQR